MVNYYTFGFNCEKPYFVADAVYVGNVTPKGTLIMYEKAVKNEQCPPLINNETFLSHLELWFDGPNVSFMMKEKHFDDCTMFTNLQYKNGAQ